MALDLSVSNITLFLLLCDACVEIDSLNLSKFNSPLPSTHLYYYPLSLLHTFHQHLLFWFPSLISIAVHHWFFHHSFFLVSHHESTCCFFFLLNLLTKIQYVAITIFFLLLLLLPSSYSLPLLYSYSSNLFCYHSPSCSFFCSHLSWTNTISTCIYFYLLKLKSTTVNHPKLQLTLFSKYILDNLCTAYLLSFNNYADALLSSLAAGLFHCITPP